MGGVAKVVSLVSENRRLKAELEEIKEQLQQPNPQLDKEKRKQEELERKLEEMKQSLSIPALTFNLNWCLKQANLSEAQKHTIEELLKIVKETDCNRASGLLSGYRKITLMSKEISDISPLAPLPGECWVSHLKQIYELGKGDRGSVSEAAH